VFNEPLSAIIVRDLERPNEGRMNSFEDLLLIDGSASLDDLDPHQMASGQTHRLRVCTRIDAEIRQMACPASNTPLRQHLPIRLSRVLARDETCGPGGKELFEAFERSPLIREMFCQSLPVELDVPADELRAACPEDRDDLL
jgi:hypothetical protein